MRQHELELSVAISTWLTSNAPGVSQSGNRQRSRPTSTKYWSLWKCKARSSAVTCNGMPVHARWRLMASGESGPHVPVLATLALLRRLRDGTLDVVGACPCTGILSLDDFSGDIARLGIHTAIDEAASHRPRTNGQDAETSDGLSIREVSSTGTASRRDSPAVASRLSSRSG